MVIRCRPPDPPPLIVTFEREGEEPISIEAPDGEKAILRTVTLLLAHRKLQPGDRIIVVAAE